MRCIPIDTASPVALPSRMKIPRIYVPQPLAQGTTVVLDERATRHTIRVLRLREGQPLTVFNGDSNEWQANITRITGSETRIEIRNPVETRRESPLLITLMQGVSRGERMDYTLQKAVELGVTRIAPVWTDRSQVKLSGERLERRIAHWQGVIIHACEQSGRTILPGLDPPQPLHSAIDAGQLPDLGLVLEPSGNRTLETIDETPATISLLAGPEGGLTESEADLATRAGFISLRLGPRILRTETAALAALATLQARWGDFR